MAHDTARNPTILDEIRCIRSEIPRGIYLLGAVLGLMFSIVGWLLAGCGLANLCTTVTTKQGFANAVYVSCVMLIFPLFVFCVYCLSVLVSCWMRVCVVVIATYS